MKQYICKNCVVLENDSNHKYIITLFRSKNEDSDTDTDGKLTESFINVRSLNLYSDMTDTYQKDTSYNKKKRSLEELEEEFLNVIQKIKEGEHCKEISPFKYNFIAEYIFEPEQTYSLSMKSLSKTQKQIVKQHTDNFKVKCLNNIGMENRFVCGRIYNACRHKTEKEMICVYDNDNNKVECMSERFEKQFKNSGIKF